MKTAMEQLIDYLDPIHEGILHKAIALLKVEQEQIAEAWDDGNASGWSDGSNDRYTDENGEKYYQNIFGKSEKES